MDKHRETVESQAYEEKRKRFEEFAELRNEVKRRLKSAKNKLTGALRDLELATAAMGDLDMDVASARANGGSGPRTLMEDAMAQIVDCWRTPDDLAHDMGHLSEAIRMFKERAEPYLADGLSSEDLLDNYFGRRDHERSRVDMADLLCVDEDLLHRRRSRASGKVRKNRESIEKARSKDPTAFLGIRRPLK